MLYQLLDPKTELAIQQVDERELVRRLETLRLLKDGVGGRSALRGLARLLGDILIACGQWLKERSEPSCAGSTLTIESFG